MKINITKGRTEKNQKILEQIAQLRNGAKSSDYDETAEVLVDNSGN